MRMQRPRFTSILLLCISGLPARVACSQPDTLHILSGDSLYSFAVVYDPMFDQEQFKRTGRYAMDTSKVAVIMDYKRGKPSGMFRAYYPNGTPLITAVYGYGSLHGDWTEYDEFGRITVKGQYERGVRHGTWAFRKEGIVGNYRNGLKDGKWKYYDRDGRITRIEKYHKDVLVPGNTYRFP